MAYAITDQGIAESSAARRVRAGRAARPRLVRLGIAEVELDDACREKTLRRLLAWFIHHKFALLTPTRALWHQLFEPTRLIADELAAAKVVEELG